jgi:hypothetical protein
MPDGAYFAPGTEITIIGFTPIGGLLVPVMPVGRNIGRITQKRPQKI